MELVKIHYKFYKSRSRKPASVMMVTLMTDLSEETSVKIRKANGMLVLDLSGYEAGYSWDTTFEYAQQIAAGLACFNKRKNVRSFDADSGDLY